LNKWWTKNENNVQNNEPETICVSKCWHFLLFFGFKCTLLFNLLQLYFGIHYLFMFGLTSFSLSSQCLFEIIMLLWAWLYLYCIPTCLVALLLRISSTLTEVCLV